MEKVIKRIGFEDKTAFKILPDINIKQKTTSNNINEIKNVVNNNADIVSDNIDNIEINKNAIVLLDEKITTNKDEIDKLKQIRLFNYKGRYNPALTYNIGDLVSDVNNKEWLSVVDNNTTPLIDGDDWVLIGVEIDLTGYYTKLQTDEKLEPITASINQINTILPTKANQTDLSVVENVITTLETDMNQVKDDISTINTGKQNKLIAGRNITIDETTNTISAAGGGTGDVTKAYVDQQDTLLSNRIDTEKVRLDATITDVNTLESTTTQLETDVLANQNSINTINLEIPPIKTAVSTNLANIELNETEINALKTLVAALDSGVVKLTGNQTIDGTKTFKDKFISPSSHTGVIWEINSNGKAKHIDWYGSASNIKLLVIGKGSSSSNNMMIQAKHNLTISSTDGEVIITDVKTPTNDSDAATKKYVDDNSGTSYSAGQGISISGNTISATDITTTNQIYQINPPYEARLYSQNSDVKLKPGPNKIINCMGYPVGNIAETPTQDNEATSKKYVDSLVNTIKEYAFNTEYSTGYKIGTDEVFFQIVKKGDPYATPVVDIASSGDLISSVKNFIGIESGVIRRSGNNNQVHNINAISNSPDQHASIIFYANNKISYWFNSDMTLSNFKNKPFIAKILYTKQ